MSKKRVCARIGAVCVFISIFVYLFIHVSYIFRPPIAHTQNMTCGFYDIDPDTLDVVFMGTSGTFSAFLPMQAYEDYGYTSYNLCVNVRGWDTFRYSIIEMMKTQHPRLLVIDLHPFVVNHSLKTIKEDAYLRYNTDAYKYSINRFNLIHNEIPDSVDKLSYYFDIIKYHSNKCNWHNWNNEYKFISKGFNNLTYLPASPAVMTDEVRAFEDQREDYLSDLLEYCKSLPMNILFIYYPWGNTIVKDKDGNDINSIEYVNYLQKRVTDEGFYFYNCELVQDSFDLNYEHDLWGTTHANIYGAEKITKIVSKYLKDSYDLPDHRQEAKYNGWNEDIVPWHGLVAQYKRDIDRDIEKYNKEHTAK